MVTPTEEQEALVEGLTSEEAKVVMRVLLEHAHVVEGRTVATSDTDVSLGKRIARELGGSCDPRCAGRAKALLVERHLIRRTHKGNGYSMSEYLLFPEGEDMNTDRVIAGDRANGHLTYEAKGKYVGTCKLRNGKMDRKRFNVSDGNLAVRMYEQWCHEVREADRQECEPTGPRKPESIEVEEPKPACGSATEGNDRSLAKESGDVVYCIMTKGGEPFRFAPTLDAAIAAADMLSAALRAAGADIAYDVVEVSRWEW